MLKCRSDGYGDATELVPRKNKLVIFRELKYLFDYSSKEIATVKQILQ
jgi:hypothetical protein